MISVFNNGSQIDSVDVMPTTMVAPPLSID